MKMGGHHPTFITNDNLINFGGNSMLKRPLFAVFISKET